MPSSRPICSVVGFWACFNNNIFLKTLQCLISLCFPWAPHKYRYEYSLRGKSLAVRSHGLPVNYPLPSVREGCQVSAFFDSEENLVSSFLMPSVLPSCAFKCLLSKADAGPIRLPHEGRKCRIKNQESRILVLALPSVCQGNLSKLFALSRSQVVLICIPKLCVLYINEC